MESSPPVVMTYAFTYIPPWTLMSVYLHHHTTYTYPMHHHEYCSTLPHTTLCILSFTRTLTYTHICTPTTLTTVSLPDTTPHHVYSLSPSPLLTVPFPPPYSPSHIYIFLTSQKVHIELYEWSSKLLQNANATLPQKCEASRNAQAKSKCEKR